MQSLLAVGSGVLTILLLICGSLPSACSLRIRSDFFKTVTYCVSDSRVTKDGQDVQKALDNFKTHFHGGFEKETCLRFQELETGNKDANVLLNISFTKPGEILGCSAWGKTPPRIDGGINVYHFCTTPRKAWHETGHVFGMTHTQRRWDRDNYITIHDERINKKKIKGNYQPAYEYGGNFPYDYSIPYDFGSVMHYRTSAFATGTEPTMTAKDPLYQNTIGAPLPSFLDIYAWNNAFQCDCVPKSANNSVIGLMGILTEKYCPNGGYPDPNNCGLCKCPRGFQGHNCTEPQGLTDPNNALCGERVIQATTGTQWLVFERKWAGSDHSIFCAWHFKGFEGERIEMKSLTMESVRVGRLEIKTGRNISLADQEKPDWRLTGYQ